MTDSVDDAFSPSLDLQAKLKQCPVEAQEFAAALQAEIIRLRKYYAKLEVNVISIKAENDGLRKELERKKDYHALTDGALQCLNEYYEQHPDESV